jgi:hypothetical protein
MILNIFTAFENDSFLPANIIKKNYRVPVRNKNSNTNKEASFLKETLCNLSQLK